jgi:aconitate hydratase
MLLSGREPSHVEDVKRYMDSQGLLYQDSTPTPKFTSNLKLDLTTVEPSLSGPKRPQDRVSLSEMKSHWRSSLNAPTGHQGHGIDASRNDAKSTIVGRDYELKHGDVVIAAITSCTNTSNPSVMIAAGLVARNARSLGLSIKPWVKPSLAPGSRVVKEYYDASGLSEDLDSLGFSIVGYGCTTCIGNSGPATRRFAVQWRQQLGLRCSLADIPTS